MNAKCSTSLSLFQLLAAAISLTSAATLWADDRLIVTSPMVVTNGESPPRPAATQRVNEATAHIQRLEKTITLTDEQKTKITNIFAAQDKEIADYKTKNADKLAVANKAMQDALNSKVQADITKAQSDLMPLYAPIGDIEAKNREILAKVLTPAQQGQLADALLADNIKMIAMPAVLTDNQMKAVIASVKTLDNPSNPQIWAIVENILTPQQKAATTKMEAVTMIIVKYLPAKLTNDQLKQIQAAADPMIEDPSLSANDLAEKLSEKAVHEARVCEQTRGTRQVKACTPNVAVSNAAGIISAVGHLV